MTGKRYLCFHGHVFLIDFTLLYGDTIQVKYFIPVLIVAALTVGCGGKPHIRGKVVFSDDKSPLTQGIVIFESDSGSVSRGELDKNGNYTVGSLKTNDGLPPGKYKVYLTATEKITQNPKGGLPLVEYTVDRKYEKVGTSGLTVEVKKSMTFDFEVDRFNAPKR